MTHMNNIFVRKGGNIKKTAQIDDWSCGLGDEDQTKWGQTRDGCLQPSDRTSEDLSISLQLYSMKQERGDAGFSPIPSP